MNKFLLKSNLPLCQLSTFNLTKKALLAACLFVVLTLAGCRQVAVKSRAGEISKGTYQMLFAMFQDAEKDQHPSKKADPAAIRASFNESLKKYEAMGYLALKLGIEKDEYFRQYMALHHSFRENKAAYAWWRQQLGADFSFSDVFKFYQVKVNLPYAAENIIKGRQAKLPYKDIYLGDFKYGKITLLDIQKSTLSVEFNIFLDLDKKPLIEALPENLRTFLTTVAHDEMRKHYHAYERELLRWDLGQVAEKFLIAKYGMAGHGIYPTQVMDIPITMQEIYDEYNQNLNEYSRLLSVSVAEYKTTSEAKAQELRDRLISRDKSLWPAVKRIVKAYKSPADPRERKRRTDADNAILAAAYKNTVVTKPYQKQGGWFVGHITNFHRFEEPSIEKYSDSIEIRIRSNLLSRQYGEDIAYAKQKLNFVFAKENR